jgi:hypothetical protein
MDIAPPKVVGPNDGKAGFLGSVGVRFMIDAASRFSLVEHPMSARALGAPLHNHAREDEYSSVLQGSVGALLGDNVIPAKPAISSSNHVTSGTHFGMLVTGRPES